jgi:hypothetical protein
MMQHQPNKNGGFPSCDYQAEDIRELVEVSRETCKQLGSLVQSVEALVVQYKLITRPLLVVVCILALGSKAVEIARDAFVHPVKNVAQQ